MMKAGYGQWAVVLLIIFIIAVLGYAGVKGYNLTSLDADLFSNHFSPGCVERYSGAIKLKQPVAGAKLLVTLDYILKDTSAQRSILPSDGHYNLSVRGQPQSNQTWTIHAYYFDKTGQLAETAQEFNNLTCDQQITADLEL